MSIVCELASPFVANAAVEGADVWQPIRGHTTTCLRCQARHAAMTRTARELVAMHDLRHPAPLDLEWRVMSALEGDLAIARSWRKPVALVAAVVSMLAAVLIWRARPKASV